MSDVCVGTCFSDYAQPEHSVGATLPHLWQVVRGGPAFAVSLLVTAIEPTLRNAAALGAWQVISPQVSCRQSAARVGVDDCVGDHCRAFASATSLCWCFLEQTLGETTVPALFAPCT
jgi:hypothetical protein